MAACDPERNSRARADPASSSSATGPATYSGVLCGVGAALCWATGFVAVRHALAAGMHPADIALHRFVWAGLALIPLFIRNGVKDVGGVGWGRALVIFLLAGPVQAQISYTGFTLAPLAHGGVIHRARRRCSASCWRRSVLKEACRCGRRSAAASSSRACWCSRGESLGIDRRPLPSAAISVPDGGLLFWAIFGMLVKLWQDRRHARDRRIPAYCRLIYAPAHGLLHGFEHHDRGRLAREPASSSRCRDCWPARSRLYLYARAVTILGAGRTAVFPSLVPVLTVADRLPRARRSADASRSSPGFAVVMVGFWLALKA